MLPDICIPLSALRTSLTLWRPSPFETGGTSILTRNEHFIVDILFVKSNEPLVTWVKTFQMFCFGWIRVGTYIIIVDCCKRETKKSKKSEKALHWYLQEENRQQATIVCYALSAFVIFQADCVSVYPWMCVHRYFVPRPQPIVLHTCGVSPGEAGHVWGHVTWRLASIILPWLTACFLPELYWRN